MQRKKKPVLTIKNGIFQSPKHPLSKGVNPCFWSKNANYSVHLDLVKIRLEIMLSDFAEKKETFWTIEKTEFFKVEKIAFFSKGFHPAF